MPVPQRLAGLVLAFVGGLSAQQPGSPVRDVRGTVHGAAAGEAVRVTLLHNDLHVSSVDAAGETIAAADGSFTFRAVPWFEKQQWGHHSFFVVARSKQHVGVQELRGDAADPARVRIDLTPPRQVRGVLRGADGKPAAGVEVWARILGDAQQPLRIWFAAPPPMWCAVTRDDGSFVIDGLPAITRLHMLTRSADYARTEIAIDDPGKPVAATLEPAGKVLGTVLLPDGTPAARVRVVTTGDGAQHGWTLTADDGTFCLGGLAVGKYKVWAEAPDLTVLAVTGLDVVAGGVFAGQVVKLVKGGFIVGRLVDPDGKPIVPGPSTDVAMYGPARGDGGSCETTPVLPDGTFRIRAPAGRNHIYLRSAEGWSEPSESVVVVEGQETKVEWKLKPAGKGR